MLKEEDLIGVIEIDRQEVHPFTDKQIALLVNFANQAVIAIENARLLNEMRQRTDALGEALEQQTATSEVLRVISTSPGGLEPVFTAIPENALRICEAKFGMLIRYIDGAFVTQVMVGGRLLWSTRCCTSHSNRRPGFPLSACYGLRSWSIRSMRPRNSISRFRRNWPVRAHISSCRCSKMTS